MNPSDVFFINLRCEGGDSRLHKLERLISKAGIGHIDFKGKFVAIKIHFGEPGNLAFLRPNYAATIVKLVGQLGGKPFLTDCNTLYVGGRKNALDHLESAYKNGYMPYATGAHVIIADGLKGSDEVLVPVRNGEYVKEAKIGRALMDADIVISLAHFKGHEATGFGGALKNLGMGGGSRRGKMEMHSDGKPQIEEALCIQCGACIKICAHDAPLITAEESRIDHEKCVGCGRCIAVCPSDAIQPGDSSSNDMLNYKISEYAQAVCDGRPAFHINVVIDISPNCDCHSENDVSIVPDVGMFASFDPVALDKACVDMVNAQPPLPGTWLTGKKRGDGDNLDNNHPQTNWRTGLQHGEKIGLGTQLYNLVEVR